ncbi:M28 family peptidase [Nannocystis sp.]|uniref:M28 family metallopeptidase n=1 Tax=Nannocystis sp. TaxID=1962667 RepID=UPI0025E6B5A8|nr:M28 family peptidase [Nannocystis sp.]MBK7824224.1 M28 family peptidase [Nannocystis sp.]
MQELRPLALALLLACGREPAPSWVRPPPPEASARPAGSPRSCLADPAGSAEALRCWVEWLAAPALAGRAAGSAGGATARAGLEAVLRDMSLGPGGEDAEYTQALPQGANVLALASGSDPARASEVVMLAAHYDHLGVHGETSYLGADDNASGVAVLLEVGRRIAARPPARSVLIAAFDAEEPPAYRSPAMGSNYWVAHPTVPRGQLVAMLCMDLMGGNLWPGERTPLYVMGGETIAVSGGPGFSEPRLVTRSMHLALVEELPGGRQAFSDHGAFFAERTPLLFFTSGRSPHYHRASDLPETLDYDKLAAATVVVEAYLRWLADLPERPGWREAQPVTGADATTLADLLAAASAPTGSSEFNAMAAPVIRADLATLRRLASVGPETPLAPTDAQTVIAVSLRAQCLLAPDDEAPTATCLML